MNYETYQPCAELASLVKCFWTLEVPYSPDHQPQRILPDGCLEMVFILGDDIKRYTGENEFILQPRAMIMGQISKPFIVEPTGHVHSIAARFYPYGFANLTTRPIAELANTETPLAEVFDPTRADELAAAVITAADTQQRISIIEEFLLELLSHARTVDALVQSTIDLISRSDGSVPIKSLVLDQPGGRRKLERAFAKQVGLSPKQLARVIRLQATLRMLLNQADSHTSIAYENNYFDQAHFIKDFKEFTGVSPGKFGTDPEFFLSATIYKNE